MLRRNSKIIITNSLAGALAMKNSSKIQDLKLIFKKNSKKCSIEDDFAAGRFFWSSDFHFSISFSGFKTSILALSVISLGIFFNLFIFYLYLFLIFKLCFKSNNPKLKTKHLKIIRIVRK